jgi:hypothetical protein
MNPRSKTLAAVALATLAAASFGCANPEASFNSFGDRYDAIFASKPPTACPEAYVPLSAGGGDGKYLLVLSATQKPDEPILFLADVTTPATGGGVGIGFSLTPIDKTDRKTTVGDAQKFEPVEIDDSGKFEMDLALLLVPKEANTIAPIKVEANVTMTGNVCGDASFVCGDVKGETVTPKVNLEGSTFTLMAIEDEKAFPDPVLNCEETPAKPL